MGPEPTIFHLIGFPGAGKLTIARALADESAARGGHLVVVDNHLTGNPILSMVWSYVYEVREVVDRAIGALSPREWSSAFTNVLTEEGDRDRRAVERLTELARRCTGPGRADRHKWTDPAAVEHHARTHTLHRPTGVEVLDLDVTELPPDLAARWILDHG